jgi:hypothetical protein
MRLVHRPQVGRQLRHERHPWLEDVAIDVEARRHLAQLDAVVGQP